MAPKPSPKPDRVDLERLARDWAEDPGLNEIAAKNVEEVAAHLLEVHRYLSDPSRSGPLGYLYRRQIARVRALTSGDSR